VSAIGQPSAFRGAIFSVAIRWCDRLLGLLSTLILARLLTPADFGLVAMAMLVVGLLDIVLDLGVGAALIQNPTAGTGEFNTAWTLRLIQAALAALIIVVSAPVAATYYEDARVADVMRVVALSVFIGGLENIGIVYFQKTMRFDREFRFFLAKRAIGTVITILLAVTLRTYWALVLGTLAGRAVGVVLSYVMHEFRPRLSLARVRRIFGFSQWNIVLSIAGYGQRTLDQFVIGRRADASVLGAYTVGGEVASLPSTELLAPLGRVMFPAFVRVIDNSPELLRIVLLSLSVQALIGIPAGVGLVLVAPEVVPLVLGDQWLGAVYFIQILGVVNVAAALGHSSYYLLLSKGKIRLLALYNIFFLGLMAALLVLAFPELDAPGIARVRLCIVVVMFVLLQVMAGVVLRGFGIRAILSETWRPICASLVMLPVVNSIGEWCQGAPILVMLVCKVVTGAAAYCAAIFLLWWMAGTPESGETYLLEKLGARSLLERAGMLRSSRIP
jgi:lipopolysaccharide exporter